MTSRAAGWTRHLRSISLRPKCQHFVETVKQGVSVGLLGDGRLLCPLLLDGQVVLVMLSLLMQESDGENFKPKPMRYGVTSC